jgi:hypothetical protein
MMKARMGGADGQSVIVKSQARHVRWNIVCSIARLSACVVLRVAYAVVSSVSYLHGLSSRLSLCGIASLI